MIKTTLIATFAVALAAAAGVSAGDPLDFVNMIVSFLNNREVCQLPSYGEIDEVAKRFRDLEQSLGAQAFGQRLTADHKLLRETVLDQWDSFQRYLTSENVLRSAKKRAFLGKVEKYQEQKFGDSICTRNPDTQVLDDPEFERNPLVRYVKNFGNPGTDTDSASTKSDHGAQGQAAPSPPASPESDNDVELKFKVHNRDEAGNVVSSKQYVTKLNFDSSRPQNRITLHIGSRR